MAEHFKKMEEEYKERMAETDHLIAHFKHVSEHFKKEEEEYKEHMAETDHFIHRELKLMKDLKKVHAYRTGIVDKWGSNMMETWAHARRLLVEYEMERGEEWERRKEHARDLLNEERDWKRHKKHVHDVTEFIERAAGRWTAENSDEQGAAKKAAAAEAARKRVEQEAKALKEELSKIKKEAESKDKEVAAAQAARKRAEEVAASAKESLKEEAALAERRIQLLEKDKQELQICIKSFNMARSCFKFLYSNAKSPKDDVELLGSLQQFVKHYCRHKKVVDEVADKFLKDLEREAKESSALAEDERMNNIPRYAQRLWTSAALLNDGGRDIELCSAINDSIRLDKPELLKHLVVVIRAINELCVPHRGAIADAHWPADGRCFRGAVLPEEHRDFFTLGKKYRVPGYLATSFDERVALRFATRAYDHSRGRVPAVLWIVQVDPAGGRDPNCRCAQVNYVTSSNHDDDEQEFLFAPYSTFTVTRVETKPHRIYLEAALDNRKEPEDLPLAPWY